jgi:hypothetical protein
MSRANQYDNEPKTPSTLISALILSPSPSPTHPSTSSTHSICSPSPATPDLDFGPSPNSPSVRPTYRQLATNEARQLTLLLIQHLFPVRSSPKGLMQESIQLAEKLHDAGIRWDGKRRVMGLHLRGIWEESGRLGKGLSLSSHGPIEYVPLYPCRDNGCGVVD